MQNRAYSMLQVKSFDSDLRGRTHALRVNEATENHRFAPPDWSIMEVKSDEAIPEAVSRRVMSRR